MKKRVREEANSITANCNIKIFGKLEDPTETKEFFEKTVGSALVTEVSGFQMAGGTEFGSYFDTQQAGIQSRPRAQYEDLRGFKEGQAVITFGEIVVDCSVFYSNPGFAKAMRVTRFMALPPPDEEVMKHAGAITKLRDLLVNKSWTAERAEVAIETPPEIDAMNVGFEKADKPSVNAVDKGIAALVQVHALNNKIDDAPPPAAAAPAIPPQENTPAAPPAQISPVTPPPETQTPPQAEQPTAQTPPPAPQQTQASPQSPPVAAPPPQTQPAEQTNAGPMGFFSKETPGESAPTPSAPPEQTQQTTPPVAPPAAPLPETQPAPAQPTAASIPAEQPVVPPPVAAQKPAAPARKKLPKEIEDILKSAGESGRKELFKNADE